MNNTELNKVRIKRRGSASLNDRQILLQSSVYVLCTKAADYSITVCRYGIKPSQTVFDDLYVFIHVFVWL